MFSILESAALPLYKTHKLDESVEETVIFCLVDIY